MAKIGQKMVNVVFEYPPIPITVLPALVVVIPSFAKSIHSFAKSNFSGKCQMVEGKCFVPLSQKLSFKAASEKCIDKGGKLFEPKEENINFQVLTAAWRAFNNDTTKRFWIGITDQQEEGR